MSAIQVSEAGLSNLLQLAASQPTSAAASAGPAALELNAEEMAAVREQAYAYVTLPMNIIDIIGQLRSFLQNECEPPVYVSGASAAGCAHMLISKFSRRKND